MSTFFLFYWPHLGLNKDFPYIVRVLNFIVTFLLLTNTAFLREQRKKEKDYYVLHLIFLHIIIDPPDPGRIDAHKFHI